MVEKIDTGSYSAHQRSAWQPGEQARLRWNGFPQVPRYMDGWSVTVVGCTRNSPYMVPLYRVSVHNWRGNAVATKTEGTEYRTVRADQLME
jgi:hypothetical protein